MLTAMSMLSRVLTGALLAAKAYKHAQAARQQKGSRERDTSMRRTHSECPRAKTREQAA